MSKRFLSLKHMQHWVQLCCNATVTQGDSSRRGCNAKPQLSSPASLWVKCPPVLWVVSIKLMICAHQASGSPGFLSIVFTQWLLALQEALLALNEAVRIAQQHNDNVALAHALGALCHILSTAAPAAVAHLTEAGTAAANPAGHLSQLLKILKR